MFNTTNVLLLHDEVLKRYGGATGARDAGLLDSALNRPFQTFGGKYLYSGVFEKAAAIIESVLVNHPFIDGNKRMGFLPCADFLLDHNIHLVAPDDNRYNFVINISTGNLSFEAIVAWLQQNTVAK